MHRRISITGPESTAKSWLTKELAKYYDAVYVEEYSRLYLKTNTDYSKNDILKIAQKQLERENEIAATNEGIIFCDTDILVNKIWSNYVFNEYNTWIENKFLQHEYGLYLLCYPDIEWEYDPLRENPSNRMEIFMLYKNELTKAGFNYQIIDGLNNKRLENAVRAIDSYMENKKLFNG